MNVLERFGRFGDGRRSARKHLGGVGCVRVRVGGTLFLRLGNGRGRGHPSLLDDSGPFLVALVNHQLRHQSPDELFVLVAIGVEARGRSRAGMRGTTRRGGRHRRRTSLGCSFRRGGRCAGGLRRARQSLEGVVVILRVGNGADANGTRDGTRDGIQDDILWSVLIAVVVVILADLAIRTRAVVVAAVRFRRGFGFERGVGRGRVRKEVEVHVLEETVAFQSRDVEGFREPGVVVLRQRRGPSLLVCVVFAALGIAQHPVLAVVLAARVYAVTRDTVDPAGRVGVVATGFARGVDAEAEETTEAEVFVRIVRLALLGRWRRCGFASRTPAGPLLANDTRGLEVGFVALGRYRRAFVRPHGERVVRHARLEARVRARDGLALGGRRRFGGRRAVAPSASLRCFRETQVATS